MPRFQAAVATEQRGPLDFRAIGAALYRRPFVWMAPPLLVFALASLCLLGVTPRYTAQTRILLLQTRDTAPAGLGVAGALDEAAVMREVRRIRSPDMARRTIQTLHLAGNVEFDPRAAGVGPLSRGLIVFGLADDPSLATAESTLLQRFTARLEAFSLPRTHVVTVRFTSRDPELAARGANAIADLYLETSVITRRSVADATEPAASRDDAGDVEARVIERAAPPREPSSPRTMPLLVVVVLVTLLAAAAYVAFKDIIARGASAPLVPERFASAPPPPPERPSIRRVPEHLARRLADEVVLPAPPPPPPPPSRARAPRITAGRVGSMVGFLAGFGRSAADSRDGTAVIDDREPVDPAAAYVGWDGPVPAPSEVRAAPAQVAKLEPDAPIVAASPTDAPAIPTPAIATPTGVSRPDAAPMREMRDVMVERVLADHLPGRGLHVVGTGIGAEDAVATALVELARGLAEKGRSIIVDLNATPMRLAPLSPDGRVAMTTLDGLSELLAGESSFAEVIHRDHASRLHFIPAGRKEADFRDFDLILDAMTETYDFIVLLTPTFPHSEIAKVMAPYADLMVLVAGDDADAATVSALEHDFVAAGAREVMVSDVHSASERDAIAARAGVAP